MMKALMFAGSALALCGCVAASPELTVAPGQGKSYADLQRDDAVCRGAVAPAGTSQAGTTQGQAQAQAQTQAAAQQPAGNYYQCMAARGELVTPTTGAYPAYAAYPYAYPGYAYAYPAYPYPYYGYPYVGYPYSAAYVGPYVGFGLGIGFGGGYYGRGYYGRGFYGHGYGGRGFGHGGFGGGFHGGGHR